MDLLLDWAEFKVQCRAGLKGAQRQWKITEEALERAPSELIEN
jgi:hypothetical protein